jgi:NOL1/NOP2/sun family putative RNA methylase
MVVAPETEQKDSLPEFKEAFRKEYTELLGSDGFEDYRDMASRYAPKAIRVNTTKIGVDALLRRLEDWELSSVPWCDEGFWIEHAEEDRHDIGNLLEHILGYVYVQSGPSMIPPIVLEAEPGMKVLDMCAAPGSKATQLGQMVGDDGVVVANDSNKGRLTALGINAQRLGLSNIVVTNMQGEDLADDDLYDRVLVDAPCSGTGTVMKSHQSLQMWSESLVGRMKGIQRVLIRKGFELLRPGGTMVYSTCTLQPEENEQVLNEFLEEYEAASSQPISLPLNRVEPVRSWKGNSFDHVDDALRIHPSDNGTEGFFVAKIRKKG